jgi:hypothetical protein
MLLNFAAGVGGRLIQTAPLNPPINLSTDTGPLLGTIILPRVRGPASPAT